MSKRGLIALLAWGALLGACGGGGGSDSGTVYFKIDAATCRGTSTILDLFIDGSQVGTETITVGGTSKGYSTHSGPNFLSAKEAKSGGFVWPSAKYDIPGGGSFTLLLTC